MDIKRIAKMADKLAEEEVKEPLVTLDEAVDEIIISLAEMDEVLPKVEARTPEQKKALEQIKDILDTAIAPYTADIVELLESFEEE